MSVPLHSTANRSDESMKIQPKSPNTPSAPLTFSREVQRLIADFRGLPEFGWVPDGRPAVKLAGVIEQLETAYRIGQPGIEDTLMAHWRELVGERTAHRCRPGKIIDKRKLIILTGNPVIRQELDFQRQQLLVKINRLPGCAGIREIQIRNA